MIGAEDLIRGGCFLQDSSNPLWLNLSHSLRSLIHSHSLTLSRHSLSHVSLTHSLTSLTHSRHSLALAVSRGRLWAPLSIVDWSGSRGLDPIVSPTHRYRYHPVDQ